MLTDNVSSDPENQQGSLIIIIMTPQRLHVGCSYLRVDNTVWTLQRCRDSSRNDL